MKTVIFTLALEFANKLSTDEEIKEVARKVVAALKHECDAGNGLAPDNSDTYTKSIRVLNDAFEVNKLETLS